MRRDRFYDQYERKVYDVLTFLGDIGGLKEALHAIGILFVSFLSHKMMISKIVKKIYHIRTYNNIEKDITSKKRCESNVIPIVPININFKPECEDIEDNVPDTDLKRGLEFIKEKEHKLSKKYKHKNSITKNDMPNLFFAFLNRARFKYSLSMIF